MCAKPRIAADGDDASRCRDRALRLLGRREHSAADLVSKLRVRGFDAEVAAAAVARLSAEGAQCDARFAESYARTSSAGGHGPVYIRHKMRGRGVADSVVERALAAYDSAWCGIAAAALRKKYDAPPADAAERQKRFRFLLGRGFTPRQIAAALRGEGEGEGGESD